MADHDTHDHTGIPGCGGVVDYVEQTTPLNPVTASTEDTANTFVTGAGFTADGSSSYMVEFYAPIVYAYATKTVDLFLYDGAASIGDLGQFSNATGLLAAPAHVFRKVTPSAGTKTYSIRADSNLATGSAIWCGAGGHGNYMPAFIRVTKT